MDRPKVILVNPRMCRPSSVRLPLSLLALAAVLQGRFECQIVDGNVDPDAAAKILAALGERRCALVAFTVMPGPQVAPAIELSVAVRARHPEVPIAWGGYFPTLYPDAAVNAPYVDFVVRDQGELTLLELLERLPEADAPSRAHRDEAASAGQPEALREVAGLTWKDRGEIVHNPRRPFRSPDAFPPLPYERLEDPQHYLRPSFMGSRTAVHQAAIGCRYRCSFCGVVSMFDGHTQLPPAERTAAHLRRLRDRYGANAVQFYDHNFFDREATSVPVLEALADLAMPWWCYARADTLAGFSTRSWELIRKSRLTMAYIGAESASDEALKRMHKGSRVEHTYEVARRCREYGVVPEFSFVLGGPEDPEGEIEKTFSFIKRLKAIHPRCEVILYFYSPTPQRSPGARRSGAQGRIPLLSRYGPDGPELPTTPEEWTEPQWIRYVCHQDAPWLTARLRRRVEDFAKVLACRFPTVQDHRTPAWGKAVLRGLASWRYASSRYGSSWELDLARRLIPLRQPQRDGL